MQIVLTELQFDVCHEAGDGLLHDPAEGGAGLPGQQPRHLPHAAAPQLAEEEGHVQVELQSVSSTKAADSMF